MTTRRVSAANGRVAKAPTGIQGLDEITLGGLPKGRSTLVCGGPGCGKTLLAMEFILNGATLYNEPGVFIAFEESEKELAENFKSLGFDINKLIKSKKILVDAVQLERSEIEETGDYDLEAFFIRVANAIDTIGAKRVALDTLEVLFGGFSNAAIIRSELSRLFRWLKAKGVSVIVTGEKGKADSLTRFGIEEYVSDCVLVLDHRAIDQVSIRRLRVLKYRGSVHGTNEYPFLIDHDGISMQPISSLGLTHRVVNERIPTGIPQLDAMLGGKGFFKGSSVLVSGTAGTGKSTIAAHFVDAACARGERALYFTFEESESQILRNMRSIGINLKRSIDQGRLEFYACRPTLYGLEKHLVTMLKKIEKFKPQHVVVDPLTNLTRIGNRSEVNSMLTRLVDHLKSEHITTVFTALSKGGHSEEDSNLGISSLMDTWLLLKSQDTGGMRDHGLYILKSRGMAHSNGIRQFRFTPRGIQLQ